MKQTKTIKPIDRGVTMQINKHGSFYIRNGWPTKIIDAVSNDKFIFSPNNEVNAVDNIGVGRVMIKALRYWSTVLGITFEGKNQQGIYHSFSDLGKLIKLYDPYFQAIGTLWLLHRNLACSIDDATAWAWAFNKYPVKAFSKEDFITSFYSYIQKNGGKYAKNAIEKEFGCFKNTYVSDSDFDIEKIIDEDTIPFFAPLRLIEYVGNGMFEKRKITIKDVPIDIFNYFILTDNEKHLTQSKQIGIDLLFENEFQVGKYMNLSYSVLLELLQQLENLKKITLVNNFGNRYIEIHDTDSAKMLDNYFKEL